MAAATMLTFFAVFVQALAGPAPVRACSCITPLPTMAEVAQEPNVVVLAGTVGRQLADRTPVAVDTWFHGTGATDLVWLNFGAQAMSSCDPMVTPGERRLLVLHRDVGDNFSYSPCVASGVIGTPSGDEALASAVSLFGGEAPPTPEPTQPPATPPPVEQATDAWLFVIAAIGGATLIFVAAVLLALRRQPR